MSTPPTIGPVTFSQATYWQDGTVTATVPYTAGTADQVTSYSAAQAASSGGAAGHLTVSFTTQAHDQPIVTAGDNAGVRWNLVSDTGAVATFTATAPAATFTATFTATGSRSGLHATTSQTVTVTPPPGVAGHGAALGNLTAASVQDAATAWETSVGRPLMVRHYFAQGNMPASYGASPFHGEAGHRKILCDFEPAKDGSQAAQMDTFLGSCADAGLAMDVTLYHAPLSKGFKTPSDFFAALTHYVPVLAKHGMRHIFDLNSWQIHKRDALPAWWPGDHVHVDAFGVEFYANGYIHEGETLDAAAALADTAKVPFGLCEYGAEYAAAPASGQVTEAQGVLFLSYVLDFFTARVKAGKPQYDLLTWNDTHGGGYAPGYVITAQPHSWWPLYAEISDLMTKSTPGHPWVPKQ